MVVCPERAVLMWLRQLHFLLPGILLTTGSSISHVPEGDCSDCDVRAIHGASRGLIVMFVLPKDLADVMHCHSTATDIA